jgi:hypothetical protein
LKIFLDRQARGIHYKKKSRGVQRDADGWFEKALCC